MTPYHFPMQQFLYMPTKKNSINLWLTIMPLQTILLILPLILSSPSVQIIYFQNYYFGLRIFQYNSFWPLKKITLKHLMRLALTRIQMYLCTSSIFLAKTLLLLDTLLLGFLPRTTPALQTPARAFRGRHHQC